MENIPKTFSLLVNRLAPETKTEELEEYISIKFAIVSCVKLKIQYPLLNTVGIFFNGILSGNSNHSQVISFGYIFANVIYKFDEMARFNIDVRLVNL